MLGVITVFAILVLFEAWSDFSEMNPNPNSSANPNPNPNFNPDPNQVRLLRHEG